MEVVKNYHRCQVYTQKIHTHPTLLFPNIIVDPFTKWGLDFMTCNMSSSKGQKYIIVAVDYFAKWVEAIPTFNNDGEIAALFLFNQIISCFGIPREIFTDHGNNFQNNIMYELALNCDFGRSTHLRTILKLMGRLKP